MSRLSPQTPPILTPRIQSLILASPELRAMLLPEGIKTSPYEVLDYQATLTLHDVEGMRATFERMERIRFLQDGVTGIVDHAWGDGIVMTDYHNDAGTIEGSLRDGGQRHLVIGLKRKMRRGEVMEFGVERSAMVGFTKNEEWLETTIDHPVSRLGLMILFPKDRPCRRATLHVEGSTMILPVVELAGGKTLVRSDVPRARAHTPYVVRWSW